MDALRIKFYSLDAINNMKKIMKILSFIMLLVIVNTIAGCSNVKGLKTLTPNTFGMEEVSEHIYVNQSMPDELRLELLKSYDAAKKNIQLVYGSIQSAPDVIACSTEECYQSFGGKTSRAKSYGGLTFLLSPRGLTVPIMSHEWSHTELYIRVDSLWKMRKIPQWFDEGLAVVVSNEPTHSQEAWEKIVQAGVPTPALTELISLEDWHKAIEKYGEHTKNRTNPEKLKVVYATAGNEVRKWYGCVGQNGLLHIINMIRTGNDFAHSYRETKEDIACEEGI